MTSRRALILTGMAALLAGVVSRSALASPSDPLTDALKEIT
jgi:hypothetical protein